ncbi:GNAT superfamily N-acetyltransferase [Hamadaea flava]|uniref:GNAT family N-acetyltransferase n=1 Tax=Hamadaea flava TaxID=1742688 RepID=A0ABV8M1C3_9ACTN|nr:GNAT family N-acetyltransferase [Hamadaea flava]MCP2324461.1 GNAT superfamily N-acetyltransferase [Hamadaea flava]
MTDVVIRTAFEDDVPAVVAAYEWLFAPPGSPPPSWDPDIAADRVRQALAADDSTVLIAVESPAVDSGVVGFCTAYLDIVSVRFGRRCWVEDLATHPGRRSQGLGTLLLDAACSFARARGASHIELDSGDARVRAHHFYEARTPSWTARSFGWVL